MTDIVTTEPVTESAPPPPRRDLGARIMRGAGWFFVWVGLFLLGFVVHQVYITSWFAQRGQVALESERLTYNDSANVRRVTVDSEGTPIEDAPSTTQAPATNGSEPPTSSVPTTAPPGSGDVNAPSGDLGSSDTGLSLIVEDQPKRGTAFAKITIPSLPSLADGWTVVQGVTLHQLAKGAGHMPWTPMPGQRGNAVISGHRTTHGAPFRDLDQLEIGAQIDVETAIGVSVYEVRAIKVVDNSALWVTGQDGPARAGIEGGDHGAWLTLTTCHPKFSARKRLVVFSELVDGPNYETIQRLTG